MAQAAAVAHRDWLNVASEISIELYGSTRAMVRQVHLRRLLNTVELPSHARIVWLQKRIKPDEVLAVINKGDFLSVNSIGANCISLK